MSDDRPQVHTPRNQDDDVTPDEREAAPADERAVAPAVPVGDRERDADGPRDESHSSDEDATVSQNAAQHVPTAEPPSVDEASTRGDRADDTPDARRDDEDDHRRDDEAERRQVDEEDRRRQDEEDRRRQAEEDRRHQAEEDRRRQAEEDRRRQDAAPAGNSHDSATKVQPVVTEHPVTAPDSRYSNADATAQTEVYRPEPVQPSPSAGPTPIYVQAPVPPKKKSNRGAGVLIAFAATLLFAVLYALGTAALASVNGADSFGEPLLRYLGTPVYWVPVLVFFVAFALLVILVNRANWWAYVLGGFPVAVIVYLAYIGARLIQLDITQLTPQEAALAVQRVSTFPDGILAAVLAREIVIWAGAIISARGRRLKARNAEARAEHDRKVAETPGL